MGKAGKRKEMVEDRSGEGVLCEKVVCEKGLHYGFEKVCVSSVDMVEGRMCERGTSERVACKRFSCEKVACVSKLCVRKCVCELRRDGGRQIV